MSDEKSYYLKQYGKLIGKTVTAIAFDDSDRSIGVVFGLVFGDQIAWIQQDPEGNGPGHLEIEKRER